MENFTKKQFLDYAGLEVYDELIKAYVNDKTKDASSSATINSILKDLTAAEANIATLQTNVENNTTTISTNKNQIAENTNAIAILNGDITTNGSVDKKIADAIAELVDSAPEKFDTLKEISDWINSNETASDILVAKVTTNEAKLEQHTEDISTLQTTQAELKNYIDI